MRPNSLKRIDPTPYTAEDESKLREKLSKYCEKRNLYCISTRTIGSPHRAIFLNASNPKLLLINPIVTKYGDDKIRSEELSEFDKGGRKARTVLRAKYIEVECDNLGTVVFTGDETEKQADLNECIMVQQMIDLLDGFTIADRNVNTPVVNQVKYNPNDMVLAKNADGVIEHIKYKYVQKFIKEGYVIL